MYKVKLETFNGAVKTIEIPSKEAVNNFVATYSNFLPIGTAVKISCDALGVTGTLRGKAII